MENFKNSCLFNLCIHPNRSKVMFTINLNYKSIYMMFFYFELFIIRDVRSPHLAAPLDECLNLLRKSNYDSN